MVYPAWAVSMLAGAWLAGLGPTSALTFVTSLDMQDLVSQWKRVKRCRVHSAPCVSREGPDIVDPVRAEQNGAHVLGFWIHGILPLMAPQLHLQQLYQKVQPLPPPQIPSKIVLTVCIFTEMQIPVWLPYLPFHRKILVDSKKNRDVMPFPN